ncbi:MAG: DUF3616 domain-containing protein [Sideroxydans sp.]|nr:DUF3616 domain-containing protein [Sideroxydans sp.]
MASNHIGMFAPLTGIYEPSAVQQLAEGRFLVVEDEKEHPFSLLTLAADGSVRSAALKQGLLQRVMQRDDDFWKLDDLEGLAVDRAGFIYALTSHSRTGDGDEKKSRDKLVRFRIEGECVVQTSVVTSLKPALMVAHPVLAQAAAIREVKNEGGLNIEALEVSPDQQQLLIGLRSPLLSQRAIIARVDNFTAAFDADAQPSIAALYTLDLDGNGIRGLSYIPALGGYLVISGPVAREQIHFQLWFWSGQADAPARRVSVPGLVGFEHAEGISPAVIEGKSYILIVSDEGSREEKRCARYLLIDPAQLQIEP